MKTFDVAISYAGEERSIAKRIVKNLKNNGLSVFFDEDCQSDLFGKNLYSYLQKIYRDCATFFVCLLSDNYVNKNFTMKELESAQERALLLQREYREYILPIYVDKYIDVPGISSTVGYVSLSEHSIKYAADLIIEKPSGEQLIEASSILYNKDKDLFLKTLKDSADLVEGSTSLTHKKILKLYPRGIVTYNYDIAHENAEKALKKDGELEKDCHYTSFILSDEKKIVDIIKNNIKYPFLCKAHGTVKRKNSMVLTKESYRDLFVKYPYYKAFMQNIFTNFQLLIIGFGLSDPDFDILLQNVFSIFGSPIQEHIVIKHENEKTAKDTLYRLRYGLNFIYIKEFKDIPEILEDATTVSGNILKGILTQCVSHNIEDRQNSHIHVRSLSNIGKKCLANILKSKIEANLSQQANEDYIKGNNKNAETSELVYTYGLIAQYTKEKKARKEQKDFLIHVVETSDFSEPVAHALVHLRDLLIKSDKKTVNKWLKIFKDKEFKNDPDNTDTNNRVYKYSEAIYYLLEAKYETK